MPPSATATTSGSSSEGMVASAAPRERDRRHQTPRTSASAETRRASRVRIRSAARARSGDRGRSRRRTTYATPTRSSSQRGCARARDSARPMATIARATMATTAPASAGIRTRRAGVHARASVTSGCDDRDDRAAQRRGPRGRGERRCTGEGDDGGHHEPERQSRAITAIVASTCRRSQTRTRREQEQSDGRRQHVRLDLVRSRVRRAARTTGRASPRRTPATREAGGARRRASTPAARVSGTPARLGAALGAAQPRVTDAPANPSATTASIAQRKSVVGDCRRRPRRSPSPARRRRRSDARACGRRAARRVGGEVRRRDASSEPARRQPSAASADAVRAGGDERAEPHDDGRGRGGREGGPAVLAGAGRLVGGDRDARRRRRDERRSAEGRQRHRSASAPGRRRRGGRSEQRRCGRSRAPARRARPDTVAPSRGCERRAPRARRGRGRRR